jgi:hypothetical protein
LHQRSLPLAPPTHRHCSLSPRLHTEILVSRSSFLAAAVLGSGIRKSNHAFFVFLKCPLASFLTLFTLSTLFRLGYCIHCIFG